jgi:hypothetical protein
VDVKSFTEKFYKEISGARLQPVLDACKPWEVLPLLTERQNIYADPQKPIQVEQRLYAASDPDEGSPLLITTNFSLTFFIVQADVESSRVPAWILPVDTEGTSVLTAYSGGFQIAHKPITSQSARFLKTGSPGLSMPSAPGACIPATRSSSRPAETQGIGLAMVCRAKGYDLILIMPETMTLERRQILISLGAKILLSDGSKGMNGAEDLAHEIVKRNENKYLCLTNLQIKQTS